MNLKRRVQSLGLSLIIESIKEKIMAERGGFEPPKPLKGLHAFQACALNRSATSPKAGVNYMEKPIVCHEMIYIFRPSGHVGCLEQVSTKWKKRKLPK